MKISCALRETAAAGRTLVVAEIGQAHDGSLGILHSMVDTAAASGVDAVKFQVHIADAESSPLEPFRVRFSPVDATRFDYWRRMELPEAEWRRLKEKCDGLGVEFLATPFSNAAVDLLERIGVGRYKVGSGTLPIRCCWHTWRPRAKRSFCRRASAPSMISTVPLNCFRVVRCRLPCFNARHAIRRRLMR